MTRLGLSGGVVLLALLLLPFSFGNASTTSQKTPQGKQKAEGTKQKAEGTKQKAAVRRIHRTRKVVTAAKKVTPKMRRRSTRKARDSRSYGDSAAGDSMNGEDLVVRQAAVEALGPLNGSVVVVDPNSGRALSIVNQKLAMSGGEQPCSTIKLPVALAALSEGLITRDTQIRLNRRLSMNLTEALARSDNKFFEQLGRQMGFEKLSQYASQFGFGELAGYQISGEKPGTFPAEPPRYGGVARMSSFGEEISVTPLQMAAFVSAVGNGGTLYYLQRPRTPEDLENFQPRVKRQLNVQPLLADLREGMMAAVDYGTGRRAALPFDTVLGKTGTCNHDGWHLGWFASYQGNREARLAVVVLLRGGRLSSGSHASEVAGHVYRNLHERNYFATLSTPPTVLAGDTSAVVR